LGKERLEQEGRKKRYFWKLCLKASTKIILRGKRHGQGKKEEAKGKGTDKKRMGKRKDVWMPLRLSRPSWSLKQKK